MQALRRSSKAVESRSRVRSSEASSQCSMCRAIFDKWYHRDNWSTRMPNHAHHSIKILIASAQDGCPTCDLFLQGLSTEVVDHLVRNYSDQKSSVNVTLRGSSTVVYILQLSFDLLRDQEYETEDRNVQYVTYLEIFPSVGVTTEVRRVSEIANTEQNWRLHDDMLPARLINIGASDVDLRICQAQFLPQETQYLTLSHCWGGKVFTTLTSANFEEFLVHIPETNLSKTFRDAIEITRNLGYKYLWIDSLCIIQGDELDWQHESSKMGSIYANSTLNIAASHASSGDFGCFPAPNSHPLYGCQIIAQTSRSRSGFWDVINDALLDSTTTNVLSTRGWVFQEMFLAPRTLYFTMQGLMFECSSGKACETFPKWYDDMNMSVPAFKYRLWDLETDNINKWTMVVTSYSDLKVTFSKDKLVAISGLARLFAEKFNKTYLAGVWKEDLILYLVWVTKEISTTNLGLIPSWSWAAVDVRVRFLDTFHDIFPNHISLVLVLDAFTTVVDEPFGDVECGTIRMLCPLPVGVVLIEDCGVNVWKIEIAASQSAGPLFFILHPDRQTLALGQIIHLLPILKAQQRRSKREDVYGLIIEQVLPGSYRRVGQFNCESEDGDQVLAEAQMHASYADESFVGEPAVSLFLSTSLNDLPNGYSICKYQKL